MTGAFYWMGLAVAVGSGVAVILIAASLICDLAFNVYRKAHGMSVIFRAMRAWHEAHGDGDDKQGGA